MASSGDYSYQPTCYQLIQGAARLVSAIQTGETLQDDEYSDMLFALNGMIAAWQASGIHVWAELDATIFLQAGQIAYQLGSGSPDRCAPSATWLQTATTATVAANATVLPVAAVAGSPPMGGPATAMAPGDHIGIWLDSGVTFWTTVASIAGLNVNLTAGLPSQATSGAQVVSYPTDLVRPLKAPSARRIQYGTATGQQLIRTPMTIYSRIDFANIPNPQAGNINGGTGTPTGMYFDPQLGFALASIWPVPANNQSAVSLTVQRPLQDFLVQGNTADLPIEWSSAIRFNLAVEISPEYDVPADRFQILKALADEKFASVSMWDREMESLYFGVESFPATRN